MVDQVVTQTDKPSFAPGIVVKNRGRLWRVDAQEGDVLIATAIDTGEPEQFKFYIPFDEIRPGRLEPPSPVHSSPAPTWAAGATPPLHGWDEARRARLCADLDALYGHLYGLTREELAYILDTFPIVRRKDEAQWGEYRTKRLVLEKYEEMGGTMRFRSGKGVGTAFFITLPDSEETS